MSTNAFIESYILQRSYHTRFDGLSEDFLDALRNVTKS